MIEVIGQRILKNFKWVLNGTNPKGNRHQKIKEHSLVLGNREGPRKQLVWKEVWESYQERGRELCLCFINVEKTSDRVNWEILMMIFKEKS